MNILLRVRNVVARFISQMMLPSSFTIISDDCWGGQIYRQCKIQYLTPTVGLYINIPDYLNILKHLKSKDMKDLEPVVSDMQFPVARNPYATVFFMHYSTFEEAQKKFTTRYNRIDWSRLLVKIDLGRPGVRLSDIEEWNEMKIPNSIAFYSPDTPLPDSGVHNGLLIPDWVLNGGKMFDITRYHFNVYGWINTGDISIGWLHKTMNKLLFHPSVPEDITGRVDRLL